MSNLILPQIVANYIGSWEGHTQIEGSNLIQLNDRMTNATLDELATEYNMLTQQYLWNAPLLDLFYNEFRDRMFSDTTFSMSISWHTTQEWLKDPFVLIMVGFEDDYPIIDGNGLSIQGNKSNISNSTLTCSDFSNNLQEKIIRVLLNNNTDAIVEINNNKLKILGLENDNIRLSFEDYVEVEAVKVRTIIRKASDWDLYLQIYKALRNQKPVIVNNIVEIPEQPDDLLEE